MLKVRSYAFKKEVRMLISAERLAAHCSRTARFEPVLPHSTFNLKGKDE